jgi:radical SAM enzyme (TIGR01210 family)
MCPFTNENYYGTDDIDLDLTRQVEHVLQRSPDEPAYDVLALYNDGNFFSEREISLPIQFRIAELVRASGVRRLVVESLPQFIRPTPLATLMDHLGHVELEVGIGLQSANDFVREVCVNTSFSRTTFETAVEVLRGLGATPKIYVLIKPPFLTEGESVADALATIDYLRALGIRQVTLCPTRVARNTLAAVLYEHGLYAPPNLWSIVDVVENARQMQLRVACINLRGTDFESVFPDSCPNCADRLLAHLEKVGIGAGIDTARSCPCRAEHSGTTLDVTALRQRVASTMALLFR